MRIHCLVGRHTAASSEIWNQGFGFSTCECCGCDLVRSGREWRTVPKGFRVTWKRVAPRQTELCAAQLLFDMPVAGRGLMVAAGRRRGPLSGLLDVLGVGVRHFSWAAARRFRAWQQAMRAPRPASQPLIALTVGISAGASRGGSSPCN